MKNENKHIYILGDIHGSFKPIRELTLKISKNLDWKNKKNNILILLGDFGANFFFDYRDKNLKEKLEKYPFIYFVIRGNHEERPSICMQTHPEDWGYEWWFDNQVYVEKAYPYIKYALDDVAIYNIAGAKTLIIPGAYSVDKYYRLHYQLPWFSNEQLSVNEMDEGMRLINQNPRFDLVLSHTCSINYEPTDLYLNKVDQTLVEKNMEQYLAKIENKIDYKLWCFGHYHETRLYPKYNNKQMLMLYCDKAIELTEWLDDKFSFIDIF